MTLVWEYYKLVQGTYCIIDNTDQAQNSYDQEKTKEQKYTEHQEEGLGCVCCTLLEYSCTSNSLSVPEVLEHCGLGWGIQ